MEQAAEHPEEGEEVPGAAPGAWAGYSGGGGLHLQQGYGERMVSGGAG